MVCSPVSMMSRIDPIRGAPRVRRAHKPEADRAEEAEPAQGTNLPVPVGPARPVPPRKDRRQTDAEFAAQLIGQDGQKRGLRAGQELFDTARSTYVRTEWSGARDRRARKGRITKTDV